MKSYKKLLTNVQSCCIIKTVKGDTQNKEANKMKRFKIYINGKYLESYSKLSEAEARVRIYERQDRYERDVEGYTNPIPTYEIRK